MLTPVALVEILASVLAAWVLLTLARRSPDPHLRYWSAAFGLQALTTLLISHLQVGREVPWATAISAVVAVLSTTSMVWGTLKYLGAARSKVFAVIPLALIAFSLAGPALDLSFTVRAGVVVVGMAASLIFVGGALLRDWRRSMGARVAGFGMLLIGFHCFDYPLVAQMPALLPWGSALAAFFLVMISVGFVLLYYERAQSQLAEQESRYRSLFENAAVGIFIADLGGVLLRVNATLEQLVSVGQALRGKKIETLFETATDAHALLSGNSVNLASHAVRWRTHDGRGIDVQIFARRVTDAAGRELIEGVVVDVTQIEHLQRHLDQVQRTELLGQLAGGIAHDLNNVLTVVLANTEAVRRVAVGDARIAELLGAIRDATDQGAGLTRQLLTFTRRHPAVTETFELGPRVARVARMLQPSLGEDVELELQADADGCGIQADPRLIEQLVVNLILNARDAVGRAGQIRVIVRVEPIAPSGQVVLEVSDTGVGMDPATVRRIFEPFFSTKEHGTGLGLAVVQRVAKQSDATVEVESQQGKGALFRVRFPRFTVTSTAPVAEGTPEAVTSQKARVLVVEDRDEVRVALVDALEAAGFDVIQEGRAAAAISLIRAGLDVELLVTDVRMAEFSGPEVAAALRARRPELPVIFISGYADEGQLADSLRQERTQFISKPFVPSELVARALTLLAAPGAPQRPGPTDASASTAQQSARKPNSS